MLDLLTYLDTKVAFSHPSSSEAITQILGSCASFEFKQVYPWVLADVETFMKEQYFLMDMFKTGKRSSNFISINFFLGSSEVRSSVIESITKLDVVDSLSIVSNRTFISRLFKRCSADELKMFQPWFSDKLGLVSKDDDSRMVFLDFYNNGKE